VGGGVLLSMELRSQFFPDSGLVIVLYGGKLWGHFLCVLRREITVAGLVEGRR